MTKSALVTGASGGIGRAFAVALAREGFSVTGVARNEEKLRALTQELSGQHDYVVADLAETAGQEHVIARLRERQYDLLVNNAGVGVLGSFADVPVEKTLAMMHLNCDAVVRLAHAYLASARSGDALINVSSTLAFVPMAGMGVYCATKSFVTAFSETLWYEQKPRGVHVIGLCPGITATDFQANAGGSKDDLPSGMTQSAEIVVDKTLKALKHRKGPTIFTGAQNAMFASFGRIMPRAPLVNMVGGMMKSSSQH